MIKYIKSKFMKKKQIIPGTLRISEIFYSIICEGGLAGTPAIFIRLQGCLTKCKSCDVPHTWNSKTYSEMPEEEIMQQIKIIIERVAGKPWVVITGGEPLEQDIKKLLKLLRAQGFKIALETNASIPVPYDIIDYFSYISISPKNVIDENWFIFADEVRVVIEAPADLKTFPARYNDKDKPVYLQANKNSSELNVCIFDFVRNHANYKMGFKLQDFWGIK